MQKIYVLCFSRLQQSKLQAGKKIAIIKTGKGNNLNIMIKQSKDAQFFVSEKKHANAKKRI